MSDFYRESSLVARIEHKCCECRGVIEKGERYMSCFSVWDGTAQRFKACMDCNALRAFVDEGCRPDELTPFGHLSDAAADCGASDQFDAIKVKRMTRP